MEPAELTVISWILPQTRTTRSDNRKETKYPSERWARARINVTSARRPYEDHRAYCLFFSKGICGKCITRCPVDALSENGHDKLQCYSHLKPFTADYVKPHYGFDGYGCGLCQTKVPCESKIPTRKDLE